jgi:hypothetical protein
LGAAAEGEATIRYAVLGAAAEGEATIRYAVLGAAAEGEATIRYAMARTLRGADLLRRRDHNFRRTPSRRVRSRQSALAFVDAVGCCSTFYRFPEGLPCLWEAVVGRANPRWPRHSHHDEGVGLTWRLKDELPARRDVYYGKVLKGRPVLVALDLFPAFYARVRGSQRSRDYLAEYRAGRLSHTARRLLDALAEEHPQYTRSLRANTFMLEASKTREFEGALAELQGGLWVVKTEERYEPSFSYRWDLVDAWLPEAVAEGRRLPRRAALEHLLRRHLAAAVYSRVPSLARLFGATAAEVVECLRALERSRAVIADCAVDGWPGRWVVALDEPGR